MKKNQIYIPFIILFFLILIFLTVKISYSGQKIYRPYYTVLPSPDGNHYIEGNGIISRDQYIETVLPDIPVWITAHPLQGGSVWYATLADGSIWRIEVKERKIYSRIRYRGKNRQVKIPVLIRREKNYILLPDKLYGWNYDTFPVPIGTERFIHLDNSSDLYLTAGRMKRRIFRNILRDSRIIAGSNWKVIALTGNSRDYRYGILGDIYEATGFMILETGSAFGKSIQYAIAGDGCFQSLFPLWKDLNGDGEREIVLTKSRPSRGSWIQVFSENGRLIAESGPPERGYRWIHLVAAAEMGREHKMEIVSVKTPHSKGVLEFYRLEKRRLRLVHSVSGYSTHRNGSRNLHNAVVSDFNSDGINDIILPVQDFTELHNLQRKGTGTVVNAELPLGSELVSNLHPVVDGTGALLLGTGLKNRKLRIFITDKRKRLKKIN
jgi:hypothetical protein